ncbi:ankyrin repeat family A protein 2-like [Orbicella faveolata]|uniref:ankyrin repeat family A protein 2-like n=1 Tax=Orbicella faveolata TaxID=48498 RepID=UPI0009E25EBA|nr:ankyrin repeat family A protein 2-like [Orbicella faveolata]
MLGNQESQGEPQDQLASHLEPDQEVAAVLGKEANFPQSGLPASVKRGSRSSSTKELTTGVKLEQEVKESLSNGDTAAQYPSLHFLAAQGEIAKIKEEIDKGTDVNTVDKTGLTPLAWAAAHRQKATITVLLKSGADATLCSPTGETALSFAACQGQLDAVEQLLEYGADPDVANAEGGTPLMYAAYNGYPQVVKLLLEHGADLTATNNEGHTALSLAVGVGNKNVQRVMEDYLRSILENRSSLPCSGEIQK